MGYPNKPLGEPVREFENTVAKVAVDTFAPTDRDELVERLNVPHFMPDEEYQRCPSIGEIVKLMRAERQEAAARIQADAATIAAKDAEIERLNERLVETQMRAFKWMEAHDKLQAGKPYSYPTLADVPDALATIARMREALLNLRRLWLEQACPRDPVHAGTLADEMDAAFDAALKGGDHGIAAMGEGDVR